MPNSFRGFSPKAITFLRQLARNNSRDWFQPRKEQFEELLRQPMLELAGVVADQLRLFAVDYVTAPTKAVHRIYRDVRFSKDKSPYKNNLSAMFHPKGLSKMAGGGFYFSLSGEMVDIAGGVYMPGGPELKLIRQEILDHPKEFRRAVAEPKMIKIVGPLRGEKLTRPPKGIDPDHADLDLLQHKQFYYHTSLPTSAATSPGFDKLLVKHFKAMAPAMDYLNGILLRAEKADGSQDDGRPKRPKPMF